MCKTTKERGAYYIRKSEEQEQHQSCMIPASSHRLFSIGEVRPLQSQTPSSKGSEVTKSWAGSVCVTLLRVSNLKYESARIDSKTVVFIGANPGKKETTEGSGSNVNFIRKQYTFPEVVSPGKWYVTNIKRWA